MAGILDFIMGLVDLGQGAQGRDLNRGSTAADIADPFRGQRGQYQDRLSTALGGPREGGRYQTELDTALRGPGTSAHLPQMDALLGADREGKHQKMLDNILTNPGAFKMDPGAQFAMEQGLEGVARKGNAMFGGSRVGNTAVELNKFATGFAGEQYGKRVDQLGNLMAEDNRTRDQFISQLAGINAEDNRNSSNRTNSLISANQEDNRSREAYINQLLGASGANTGSPGTAAQAYLGGFANQDRRNASGVAGLGAGLGDIMSLLGGAGSGMQSILNYIFGGGDNGAGSNGSWDVPGDTGGGGSNGSWDVPGDVPYDDPTTGGGNIFGDV